MKFLCVKCDDVMKLKEVSDPDDSGSLAVIFMCAGCSSEVAMLTNPHETQLVSSLGVRIGPKSDATGAAAAQKCPFTQVVRDSMGDGNQTKTENLHSSPSGEVDEIVWLPEATDRLEKIPDFIRPMAKIGIEKFARDNGLNKINAGVLEQAKGMFGINDEMEL